MTRSKSDGGKIEALPWGQDFDTGIEVIDLQHRQLVRMLNDLIGIIGVDVNLSKINMILEDLTDYAAMHFSTEEMIWHRHITNDAWERAHQAEHRSFVEKVRALRVEQGCRPPQEILEEITAFLRHWLTLHIIESDKRMDKAVLALSPDVSLERAKEIANEQMSGAAQAMADKTKIEYGQSGV